MLHIVSISANWQIANLQCVQTNSHGNLSYKSKVFVPDPAALHWKAEWKAGKKWYVLKTGITAHIVWQPLHMAAFDVRRINPEFFADDTSFGLVLPSANT